MKKLTLTLLTCLFIVLSAPVESKKNNNVLSTQDWHDACTRTDQNWISFCHGYIQAVVDSYKENEICIDPSAATRAKLVGIVDLFLRKNPEYKIGRAFGQIKNILKLAYPCK